MGEISVVIPLHNKRDTVLRAVRSVLAQTQPWCELIVVDDGSTDGSAGELLQVPSSRNLRIITKPNGGVSSARNTGISSAKGELVAFLDADDEWKPSFLAQIEALSQRFPRAGAFATAYVIQDRDGRVRTMTYYGLPRGEWTGVIPDYFGSALDWSPLCSSSVAVRKEAFRRVGFFDESLHVAEDLHMWGRIALSFPIAYDGAVGSVVHEDSPVRSHLQKATMRPRIHYLEDFEVALEDPARSPESRQSIHEYIMKKRIEAAVWYVRFHSEGRKARELLKDSVGTRRFRGRWVKWYLLSCLPSSLRRTLLGFDSFLRRRRRGAKR